MRRLILPSLALVLVLVVIRGMGSWAPPTPPQAPSPTAEPVPEVSSVRLRRGQAPERSRWQAVVPKPVRGLPVVGAADGVPDRPPPSDVPDAAGPQDVFDLPQADQDRVMDAAGEAIAELGELCAESVPAEGVQVLAALTVDDQGLIEAELSTYADAGEAMFATADPLPDRLVGCLDDELWARGWPEVEGGARFALTLRLEPPE